MSATNIHTDANATSAGVPPAPPEAFQRAEGANSQQPFPRGYTRTVKNMHLCCLTEEQRARTCRYWYTVTTYGGTPETAFRSTADLVRWAEERGLSLPELPAVGEWASFSLAGSYRETSYMRWQDFEAIDGDHVRQLSNGQYTLGKVTRDADGVRTVHYLNPNCSDRVVFDYAESERLREG